MTKINGHSTKNLKDEDTLPAQSSSSNGSSEGPTPTESSPPEGKNTNQDELDIDRLNISSTADEKLSPSSQGVVPHDGQLLDAVLPIREKTPSLGVPKLLIKIKETNPDWQLSEKRLRKFLNSSLFPRENSNKTSNFPTQPKSPAEPMWLPNYSWEKDWEAASVDPSQNEPVSSLDDTLLLECRQRSVKIEPVRFPASNKGSGLIAKDYLPKGTQVIKEDAFVWVPPTKNMSRSVMSGQSCALCGRAFSMQRTKAQPTCPHHPAPGSKEAIAAQQLMVTTSTSLATGGQSVTEKPAGPEPCYMRYCTRVCAQRSVDYFGPLVCPQKNPEYMQLLRFTDAEDFRGAHMVFKMFARMLIANESGEIASNPAFKPTQPKANPNGGSMNNGESESQEPNGSDDPITAGGNKKHKKAKSKKKSLANQSPPSSGPSVKFEETYSRIHGLATMSDRARREKYHGGSHLGSHFADVRYGQMWRNGWHAVIKALHINTGYRPPASDPNQQVSSTGVFWDSFWKRRLDPETIAHYFGLKSFLEFVGKTSLNREADHGLYLLHARFNHSCEPNAVVLKHHGSEDIHKSAPSTIYVMTRKDIAKDEEVTLSYINPDLSLEARRCRKELEQEEERNHYIHLMEKMRPACNDDLYHPNLSNNHSLKNRISQQPTTTENEDDDNDNEMSFSCF